MCDGNCKICPMDCMPDQEDELYGIMCSEAHAAYLQEIDPNDMNDWRDEPIEE